MGERTEAVNSPPMAATAKLAGTIPTSGATMPARPAKASPTHPANDRIGAKMPPGTPVE